MMLIVDDERTWIRTLDTGVTVTVRTVADAIKFLERNEFTEISLDHDLGPNQDIRVLVHWIVDKKDKLRSVQWIYVHTMNPVGAEWIMKMLSPSYKAMRIPLGVIGQLVE